jgi:serine/threonine protein kinase
MKILNLVGACAVAPNYCIVSQFCANGSLENLLRGRRAIPNLAWSWLVKVAADAAAGILHLHAEGIIHRV